MVTRDPLSIRYDATVHPLLIRAARASRDRHGILAWVTSPTGEYRQRDQSGRTPHERAFTRSAYYILRWGPLQRGETVEWSLKLTWGDDDTRKLSRSGYLARPVLVRLYPRSEAQVTGRRYIPARPGHHYPIRYGPGRGHYARPYA